MAEVVQNLHELQALPPETHWFCPCTSLDDYTRYYEEDLLEEDRTVDPAVEAERIRKIEEAQKRKHLVLDAFRILAYNGAEAAPYRDWLQLRLEHWMTTCHICIRVFHASRSLLRQRLEEQYDVEQVVEFMKTFDELNVTRITQGLKHAQAQLASLPESERKIANLGSVGIHSLFEVLSCEPYLRNPTLMAQHFDSPFQLVQTRKKLRLHSFLPALSYFFFSSVESRYSFAVFNWEKLWRSPTRQEFEWAIRRPLFEAMMRVQISSLDMSFVPRFWDGARLIVSKLNKDLVTHSLRGIDISIYRLALEHLQLDSPGFTDLLRTVRHLIELSPTDFWDAMGAIPPSAFIEQIFHSPALKKIFLRQGQEDAPDLGEIFGWILPFLTSIKPQNITPACRSMVHQLMTRNQDNGLPTKARVACFNIALLVLSHTLENLSKERTFATFVGTAVVSDMLDLVKDHVKAIVSITKNLKNPVDGGQPGLVALTVVERSIALDCLALSMRRESIHAGKPIRNTDGTGSEALWNALISAIDYGDQALATYILLGTRSLVGLERFTDKYITTRKSAQAPCFNKEYDQLCNNVARVLERLQDFHSFDLAGIFKTPHTSISIVSTLVSSHHATRQSAMEVLKVMSSQPERREALAYVIRLAYLNFISALTQSMKVLASKKIFAPMPHLVKLSIDVVDLLGNSQDGLLMLQKLSDAEAKATLDLWAVFWQVLTVVFDSTEGWSGVGHDKEYLREFCRDVMQFADALFGIYNTFVNAVAEIDQDTGKDNTEAFRGKMLQHPKETMLSMVRWLRLRDEFLVYKIVYLVTKVLEKLQSVSIMVSTETLNYIESVINGQIRANLSNQQIAELTRSFEKHTGRSLAPEPTTKPVLKKSKQRSISDWAKPGITPAPRSSSVSHGISDSESNSEAMDKVISGATKGADRFKKLMDARKAATEKQRKPTVAPKPAPIRNVIDSESFKAKRAAEMEAKRKRDAAAITAARAGISNVGSAIKGLGIPGYLPESEQKGSSMMVSSSESSEDDDSDNELDVELFGGPTKSKPAGPKQPHNLITDIPLGPVKVRRIPRTAASMRARLKPDLTSLHAVFVSWNFFHEGDTPPGPYPDIYSRVPTSFRSPQDYKNVFQPLLMLEAWQGLVQQREEGNFKPYEVNIVSRSSVDSLMHVSSTVDAKLKESFQVGEGDIVLLSSSKNPHKDRGAPNCLAYVMRATLKKGSLEVQYKVSPSSPLVKYISPKATLYAVKVDSIISMEREYASLMTLEHFDLCQEILQAVPSHLLKYADTVLQPIMDSYKLNRAQAKAVKSAIDSDAFTLIQGPPGTGKTKTIVALVGALLTPVLRETKATPIAVPTGAQIPQQNQVLKKKLLVCAPSNAAVDEIVMRLMQGVTTTTGTHKKINVIRVGRTDAVSAGVADVTLESLVNARMEGTTDSKASRGETQHVFTEHQSVSARINEAYEQLREGQKKGADVHALQDEIGALKRRRTQLSSEIDMIKDNEKSKDRQAGMDRMGAQDKIIDEAHVICATLNTTGHDIFRSLNVVFETVIVDEAAQCVEVSSLIPLKYGCVKCILVGDPKQLPPTVFSREAAKFQYEQSLFVRMQSNKPDRVHLLDTQYRMHPDISSFPSATFYDGKLVDGDGMANLRIQPWHAHPLLSPYRFFDVKGRHESASGHSLVNHAEINVAFQLYEALMKFCPDFQFPGKIGIITPYKSQLRLLREKFSRVYGNDITEMIEFNTTDAYQGRESEIIIFSCVRASRSGGIGFLQDIRRMNVGLTRAKSSLFVLGNSDSLQRGEFWGKLIKDSVARQLHTPADALNRATFLPGNEASVQSTIPTGPCGPRPKIDADGDLEMSDVSYKSSKSSDAERKVHVRNIPRKRKAGDFDSDMVEADTGKLVPEALVKKDPFEVKKMRMRVKEEPGIEKKYIEEEKPEIKREEAASKGPAAASANKPLDPYVDLENSNPGSLVPPPPGAGPPIRRRRPKGPANPLLQPNRPKKQ